MAGLQEAKRAGKLDDALMEGIGAMRHKVVEYDFDMKESKSVRYAVDDHRVAGIGGYVVLFLILLTLCFGGAMSAKP